MREFRRRDDEREQGRNWINLPNILIAAVLIFFIVLALGLKYLDTAVDDESTGSEATTTTKAGDTTTEPLETSGSDSEITLDELLEREAELNEKIEMIKEIAGVRTRIIEELKTEVAKTDLVMDIDEDTGDIRLSEALLFGVSEESISSEGQAYLSEFVPILLSVVLSEENRQYVDQIIIEGHTDDEGTYLDNLALSQRRAVSVAVFIFQNDLNILSDGTYADSYFTISGRSYSLLVTEGGIVNRELSRRVEFKFMLKDEEMIQQMQDIFEGDL